MKKRGRPKGITQTVIGLPKKQERKNKCVPFDQKPSRETDLIMLEWFVGKDIATSALNDGLLIKKEYVETRPEMVSSSCLDKLVNITLIKKYCTEVFIRLKFEIMCTYVIFAKAMPMKKSQVLCVVLALNGNTLHMQD
jgi:hypothetical protein